MFIRLSNGWLQDTEFECEIPEHAWRTHPKIPGLADNFIGTILAYQKHSPTQRLAPNLARLYFDWYKKYHGDGLIKEWLKNDFDNVINELPLLEYQTIYPCVKQQIKKISFGYINDTRTARNILY